MDGVLDANPSRPTRSIPMAVVISEMSMSLDGFVADPADQVGPLFDWYANGEVEVPTAVPERWTFRTSEASAGYLRESMGRIGALVAGRRLFDIGRWGEHGHPYGVPVFVVTHDVPQGWPREDAPLPITFVTDGVEHAVAQAKTTAGEGWVGVAGPTSPSSAWTPACSTRCGSTWCPSCSARASATSTSSRTRRSHWRIHGSSRALASPISSTASPGSSARRSMTRSAQALRAGPPVARQLGRAPRVAVGEGDSAGVGSAPLSLAEVLAGEAAGLAALDSSPGLGPADFDSPATKPFALFAWSARLLPTCSTLRLVALDTRSLPTFTVLPTSSVSRCTPGLSRNARVASTICW